MAVFRVEKNKGYTVMSNHHLRNKELITKAENNFMILTSKIKRNKYYETFQLYTRSFGAFFANYSIYFYMLE